MNSTQTRKTEEEGTASGSLYKASITSIAWIPCQKKASRETGAAGHYPS